MLNKRRALKNLVNVKENWNNIHNSLDKNIIFIGNFTYGQPNVIFWDNNTLVKIGKFCSLASGVTILAGGEHRSDWISTYPFNALVEDFNYIKGHPATKGNITIGNDVWIGESAKILSGVTIGDGAVVGSSSVVTKDVPPYAIVAGNPAKIIKYRFDDETIEKLLEIKWWDFDEKDIIKIIPILQSNDIEKFIKKCKSIKKN